MDEAPGTIYSSEVLSMGKVWGLDGRAEIAMDLYTTRVDLHADCADEVRRALHRSLGLMDDVPLIGERSAASQETKARPRPSKN